MNSHPAIHINRFVLLLTALVMLSVSPAPSAMAQGAPTATPTVTPTPITLKQIADKITEKVGKVVRVIEGDPKRAIVLFEEQHNSRLGQTEIAAMLNRLYEKYGVRHIGLEGYFPEKGPLKLAWAHRKPHFQTGQKIATREDVIAYTLKAGEISSAEFMGLIYADILVHGIDDAKLYATPLSPEAEKSLANYLLNIAYTRANAPQRAAFQALRNQQKHDEAETNLVNTDKFTADAFARTTDRVNPPSVEETLDLLDRIEQEAQRAGYKPSAALQSNLQALRNWMKSMSQRSDAMVANTLKLFEANPGAPIAITIGAGHTSRMVELFAKQGVSLAVIRSASMAEASRAGLLSNESFRHKTQGRSVAPPGQLGALLEGRVKPPAVADEEWYKQQVRILEYLQDLAWATASNLDVMNAITSASEKWAGYFADAGILSAYASQINDSTSPAIVRATIQLQDGRTLSGDTQLDLGKVNAFDLEGLLALLKDNLQTEATTGTQQISSNAQVTWTGSNIPDFHQEPFWWTITPDATMVTVMSDGTKVTKFKDGKVVTEYKDGTKVTENPGISKVTVKPDGTKVVEDFLFGTKYTYYKDGPLVVEERDGSVITSRDDTMVTQYPWDKGHRKETVYYERDDKDRLQVGRKVTEYDGGLKVTEYPDGTTVREYPGGRTETSKPEEGKQGKVVTERKDDHTEVEVYEDGTKVTTEWREVKTWKRSEDGTRVPDWEDVRVLVTEYKSGRKVTEYFYGDRKLTEYPGGTTVTEYKNDGHQVTEYKDGTRVTEYADGRKNTYDPKSDTSTDIRPDGSEQTRYGDGTSVTHDPDGTTTYGSSGSTMNVTIKPDGTGQVQGLTPSGKWVDVPLDMTGIETGLGTPKFSVTDSGDVVITWSLDGTKLTVKPDGTTTIERP